LTDAEEEEDDDDERDYSTDTHKSRTHAVAWLRVLKAERKKGQREKGKREEKGLEGGCTVCLTDSKSIPI